MNTFNLRNINSNDFEKYDLGSSPPMTVQFNGTATVRSPNGNTDTTKTKNYPRIKSISMSPVIASEGICNDSSHCS